MKKLAILALISAPAFAHQIPFSDKNFLNLTGGDISKAKALSHYCDSRGDSKASCLETLKGSGNLALEATLKYQRDSYDSIMKTRAKLSNQNLVPGLVSNQIHVVEWHNKNAPGDNGEMHHHQWAEGQREVARNEAIRDTLVAWRQTTDALSGDLTLSKSVSDVAFGQKEIAEFISIVGTREITTATEMARKLGIPDAVLKEAIANGLAAYRQPDYFKKDNKPQILCITTERDCRNVPEGENKTNTQYQPEEKDEKKDGNKKNDKTGAKLDPKARK